MYICYIKYRCILIILIIKYNSFGMSNLIFTFLSFLKSILLFIFNKSSQIEIYEFHNIIYNPSAINNSIIK